MPLGIAWPSLHIVARCVAGDERSARCRGGGRVDGRRAEVGPISEVERARDDGGAGEHVLRAQGVSSAARTRKRRGEPRSARRFSPADALPGLGPGGGGRAWGGRFHEGGKAAARRNDPRQRCSDKLVRGAPTAPEQRRETRCPCVGSAASAAAPVQRKEGARSCRCSIYGRTISGQPGGRRLEERARSLRQLPTPQIEKEGHEALHVPPGA